MFPSFPRSSACLLSGIRYRSLIEPLTRIAFTRGAAARRKHPSRRFYPPVSVDLSLAQWRTAATSSRTSLRRRVAHLLWPLRLAQSDLITEFAARRARKRDEDDRAVRRHLFCRRRCRREYQTTRRLSVKGDLRLLISARRWAENVFPYLWVSISRNFFSICNKPSVTLSRENTLGETWTFSVRIHDEDFSEFVVFSRRPRFSTHKNESRQLEK